MKQTALTSIPNTMGLLLIIVAIVSAGGLCYTASIYTDVSETYVSVSSYINDITVSLDNVTGAVSITVYILVDNPSSLDIDVYRIEYMAYMDKIPSTINNYDKYIGSGSTSDRNNTVKAESTREMLVSFTIGQDSTYYERVTDAMSGETDNVWTLIDGIVWFKIPGYGEKLQNEIYMYAMEDVEVRHV